MFKWLKCVIAKGMFSDEVAITIHSATGNVSAFVQRQDVDLQRGLVRVEQINNMIFIPDEYRSMVDVDMADLQAID